MSACDSPGNRSAEARVVSMLKDGYWDRTEVIELPDGERRVRKQSKGAAFGPWGVSSLRREIRYLLSLPERAARFFPPVLAAWDDDDSGGTAGVGYEMPFYSRHVDAGELARQGELTQAEIDEFQDALTEAVLDRLHETAAPEESLAAHVIAVVDRTWAGLRSDPLLATFIDAENIELNGAHAAGPRSAFERVRRETGLLHELDSGPTVRLHGDFFLENILWRPGSAAADAEAPRLVLVDPVSVAGVSCGPPVFDLVKYVSYASGELLALRSERVVVEGFDSAVGGREYRYRIRWEDPALQPFRRLDWHSRLHRAFEARHGTVNRRLYQLIDGYFSVAMAVNTAGVQRLARLLKATTGFNAVLRNG